MPATTDFTLAPGFQASETTGAEVRIYPQGGDPIIITGSTVEFSGKSRRDPYGSLVALQVSKTMGATGQFSFQIKPSPQDVELLDQVTDDDWADIFLTQHGKSWHVMRGLIDAKRRVRTVANRATSTVYTFSGSDFQKIWEVTPIWFDHFSGEKLGGGYVLRMVDVPVDMPPNEVIKAFLEGFIKVFASVGRANWKMPYSMDGCGGKDFIEAVKQDYTSYLADPIISAVAPNFAGGSGNLWATVREWADLMFNELYTDLVPIEGEKCGEMTVIFRTKPFPVMSGSLDSYSGKDSLWFQLPQVIVPPQQIVTHDVGTSGAERYNAFFVGGQIQQQFVKNAADLARPLWDTDAMLLHGLRRMDFESHYIAENSNMVGMNTKQRQQIRDWYALNPYLLSGQIGLGIGRPDARIGMRLAIPDNNTTQKDERYYIEGVSHNWSLRQGQKTTLTVTRGWIGTEDQYLTYLDKATRNYTVPRWGTAGA